MCVCVSCAQDSTDAHLFDVTHRCVALAPSFYSACIAAARERYALITGEKIEAKPAVEKQGEEEEADRSREKRGSAGAVNTKEDEEEENEEEKRDENEGKVEEEEEEEDSSDTAEQALLRAAADAGKWSLAVLSAIDARACTFAISGYTPVLVCIFTS